MAPGLGLVGLLVSFALILKNLPGLVGNSTPIAIGVVVLLVAVFAAGAGIAARRPHVVPKSLTTWGRWRAERPRSCRSRKAHGDQISGVPRTFR